MYQLPQAKWTYMPRERNIVADELAGKASEWLESVISVFDMQDQTDLPTYSTVPLGTFVPDKFPILCNSWLT